MTRSLKDSTDVTLVIADDMIPKGHEVVLSSASVHGVELPPGWKMKEQLELCYQWVESEGENNTLPHYLNAGKIMKKMKDDAICPPYKSVLQLHGGSFTGTIKFSTGMYYAVLVPLVWDWLGMVGKSATREEYHGVLLKVEAVTAQQDKAGAAERYKVNLLVENELVVVHFYNTTHKILVQGKMMAKTFSEKVLNPFFDSESRRRARNITSINDQMGNTLRGEKRTRDQTRTKETPQPKKMASNKIDPDVEIEECEKDAEFRQLIPQGDLQLSDSILVLSTIHPPALI